MATAAHPALDQALNSPRHAVPSVSGIPLLLGEYDVRFLLLLGLLGQPSHLLFQTLDLPGKKLPGCPRSQWGGYWRSPTAIRAGRGNSVPGIGRFLLRFRPMTNRNTRSGKLAFLLIALVVLAGFQPGPAKTQDIEQLRMAAEQGHAVAQYFLGTMYSNGEGMPQDYQEAVSWYRKAAEQGDAGAQYNLGNMYNNSEGVPQDYVPSPQMG